jgi:hypothetical protein
VDFNNPLVFFTSCVRKGIVCLFVVVGGVGRG